MNARPVFSLNEQYDFRSVVWQEEQCFDSMGRQNRSCFALGETDERRASKRMLESE